MHVLPAIRLLSPVTETRLSILPDNRDSSSTSRYEAVSYVILPLFDHTKTLMPCSLKLGAILNSVVLLMSYNTLILGKVKYFKTFSKSKLVNYVCLRVPCKN